MNKTGITKRPSLFLNYIYNLSSQLLNILFPIITAPYLARVLHEEGNGQIAFVNSVVAYFVSFTTFGFAIYGQREVARYKDDAEKRSRIFFEILILKVLFCTVSVSALFLLIHSPYIMPGYKSLMSICSIQVVSVVFDIRFFFWGIEDFREVAIRTIIMRLLGIVCMFIFVKEQNDVWKYLLYISLIGVLANVIMWPKALRLVKPAETDIRSLKAYIRPLFFIYLPVLAETVFSALDSTMIGYLADNREYENGCYGSAIKIVNVVSVIMMADGLVFASRNASDYTKGHDDSLREHLRIAFRYVWMIGFPIIAGILVLSDQISLCVFGQGYEKVPLLLRLFTVRVLTHGIMNVIVNQYLLPTGREKICTALNFSAIAANIILNRILIPENGCIGAAIASIISEALLTLAFFAYFAHEKKYWNKAVFLQSYKYIIASLIMCIPVITLKQALSSKWYYLGMIISIGALVYGLSLLALKDEMILVYGKRIIAKIKEK